jgi:hypothetical protein
MKSMNKLMIALVSGAFALGGGSAAFAQETEPQQEKTYEHKEHKEGEQAKKSKMIEGEVQATQKVQVPGTDQENLVVLVETKDGQSMMVDLGPAQELEDAKIREGTTLSAQGQVMDVEGRQLMAADNLEIEGQKHQIKREAQPPQAQMELEAEQEAEQAQQQAEQAQQEAEQAEQEAERAEQAQRQQP